jgi:glycosyl transferase family 1
MPPCLRAFVLVPFLSTPFRLKSKRVKKLAYLAAPRFGDTTAYPVQAMERQLAAQGLRAFRSQPIKPIVFTGKVLAKLGMVRNFASLGHAYVLPMLHCSEYRLFRVSYLHECIPYTMDVWPWSYARREAFARRNRIRTWFITARRSAQVFKEKFPHINCLWLAEAVDPTEYRHDIPLEKRTIHVLELGRRWEAYHAKIADTLEQHKRTHLYEKVKGKIIFATRQDLIDGLVNSIVSVCFPQSTTHPEKAGDVETVTLRYFETMACKCIPVGRAPQELIDLFGFNPMIEVDLDHAADQVEEIVHNPAKYQPMVERNYQRLLEVGTWEVRVRQMLGTLKKLGYSKDG